ncbi:MAG: HEPN domain-containing protein [Cyanobacteria bacterium J06638_6]
MHELAYLTRLCVEQEAEFSEIIDIASELQDYATGARYPDDELDEPTLQEAKRAVACAKEIRLSLSKEHKMPEALGVVPRLSILLNGRETLAIATDYAS